MDRGAWVATLQGVTELDVTEQSCMHTLLFETNTFSHIPLVVI